MKILRPRTFSSPILIGLTLLLVSTTLAGQTSPRMNEAMVELMATVAEMNDTAIRLTGRLHYLESHMEDLRTKNAKLQEQNERLARALKVSSRIIPTQATNPLDGEVRDANHIIETLISAVIRRASSVIGLSPDTEV